MYLLAIKLYCVTNVSLWYSVKRQGKYIKQSGQSTLDFCYCKMLSNN